jgi:hypothetical protein
MSLYSQRTYILNVGVFLLIPNLGARCFEWSFNIPLLSLYSTERTQAIHSKRGLDGHQSRFGYFGDKYYAPTGKRTTVPRLSRAWLFYYIDCAIPVLTNISGLRQKCGNILSYFTTVLQFALFATKTLVSDCNVKVRPNPPAYNHKIRTSDTIIEVQWSLKPFPIRDSL